MNAGPDSLFEDYPRDVLERFRSFHQENPQIFRKFREMAFQMIETGRTKYSARTIIETMRWHMDLQTKGDVFEINGDFVPLYVRLFIHHHPEHRSFFELRKVRSRGSLSEEEKKRREGTP